MKNDAEHKNSQERSTEHSTGGREEPRHVIRDPDSFFNDLLMEQQEQQ